MSGLVNVWTVTGTDGEWFGYSKIQVKEGHAVLRADGRVSVVTFCASSQVYAPEIGRYEEIVASWPVSVLPRNSEDAQ